MYKYGNILYKCVIGHLLCVYLTYNTKKKEKVKEKEKYNCEYLFTVS